MTIYVRTTRIACAVAAAALLVACGRNEPSLDAREHERARLSRAQKERFSSLSIRQIMQGPGVVGTAPSAPRFSADGATVYFTWNSPTHLDSLNAIDPADAYAHWRALESEAGAWMLDVAGGERRALSVAAADSLVPVSSAWDLSMRRRAEIRAGDVYLAEPGRESRRITGTAGSERSIQMAPDGSVVWFVRKHDLYSARWSGGPVMQRTRLVSGDDPDASEGSDQRRYLADQQKELFEEFSDYPEAEARRPRPVYLGKGWDVDDIQVSPSGRYAALELSREAGAARPPLVPLAVTESGYIETEETRPKVGDARGASRIAIVDLGADSLLAVTTAEDWGVRLRSWAPREDILLIRSISPDWHERSFSVVDLRGGDGGPLEPRELDRYHDDAWVGGPDFYRTGAWLPDGSGIYFICEADGWGRLYTVNLSGRRTALTDGEWEVQDAWVDRGRSCFYMITNEGRWGSGRLWRANLDGGDRRLLTPDPGGYEVTWSPRMERAAVLRSSADHPPELYLLDAEGGNLTGPFTDSVTDVFRSYAWVVPREVTFKASDGVQVRAHILSPEDFGVESNGAGVVFIHGAGYLQNVIDGWGYYYREYMFNHFLASRGYTVLNVDFRGSAGYGQACRTAIYEHMGGRDLGDIVDASRYLVKKHGVGQDQVGVYGGSYGGFLTLMALFKYPDDVRAGAALRSVTDWAHYNHWYTSRILGLPTENDEAYRRSSPIYFAEGLEGHLLMLHGLRDTNVLAQDVLRLSQRLIELNKENWELALHPAEGHAYRRADSWTDQMTRAFKLFERVLPDGAPERN